MRIRIDDFFIICFIDHILDGVVSGCTGISTDNSAYPRRTVQPAIHHYLLLRRRPPLSVPLRSATDDLIESSFNDGDNGNEVSLHKGDVFTVSLVQAMGNGYTWDASTSPGLTITDSQFKDSNTAGIAGLGNPSQVWTVEVTSDGSQWFKAENKGGTITIATYTLNIDVN